MDITIWNRKVDGQNGNNTALLCRKLHEMLNAVPLRDIWAVFTGDRFLYVIHIFMHIINRNMGNCLHTYICYIFG